MESKTNANNNLSKGAKSKGRSQQKPRNTKVKETLPDIKIEDVNDDPLKNYHLLSTHPLIRMSEKKHIIGDMGIVVQNFSLATRKARQFGIKTISDDGIYEALPVMRKLVPRGLAITTFTLKGQTETVVLVGFRKFSGMEDDSEDTINLEKAERYFRKGSMEDVTHFMATNKSNGENAKWMIREVFGQLWVFAGSKNTCIPFPLGEDSRKWHPVQSNNDYGNIIAAEVSDMLTRLSVNGNLDTFVKEVVKNSYIVMGELNHPQSEHVFPIEKLVIEQVALLGPNGTEVNPVVAFKLFDDCKLPTVSHSLNPISELKKKMQETFECKTSEGEVFYLLRETNNEYEVLALLKHKSSFYVLGRRIRQNFWRVIVDPLIEFPEMNRQMVFALVAKCQEDLRTKIPQLTFLPDCESKKDEWVATGVGFVQRWAERFARSSIEDKMQMLEDAKNKYGTTYEKFMVPCDDEDFKEEEIEEMGERSPKLFLLRAPSGSGKTHYAKKLVAEFSKEGKVAVIVSADDYFEEKGEYVGKEIQLAHKSCQQKTLIALRAGHIVIVANTNIQLWEMQAYVKMSQLFNVSIEIKNIDAFDGETPIDWQNKDKKNAAVVAKILSARTKNRDTWREEIPEGIIMGQIAKFEPYNSVVDILLTKPPVFVQSAPPKGVYNKGYAGFSHPVLMSWVKTAVEILSKSGEHQKAKPFDIRHGALRQGEHSDIWNCFYNALLRDCFVKHITLAFWKDLPKDLNQETFMGYLRNLTIKDFKNLGIGFHDGLNGNRAYYLVIECPRLLQIYKSFGIHEHYPTLHVTIGFRFEDIHGVHKGIETLMDGMTL